MSSAQGQGAPCCFAQLRRLPELEGGIQGSQRVAGLLAFFDDHGCDGDVSFADVRAGVLTFGHLVAAVAGDDLSAVAHEPVVAALHAGVAALAFVNGAVDSSAEPFDFAGSGRRVRRRPPP